ncbi:MAG: hypothetical protein V3T77_09940 [Planctomycetota bacterium]
MESLAQEGDPPFGNSEETILATMRDMVKEEVQKACEKLPSGNAATGGASGDSSQLKKEIKAQLQEALKAVLPELVKRFRLEIEKHIPASGENGSGEAAPDLRAMINSTEMKEALEERFRSMLLFLKQEVIPKAIQKSQVAT